MSSAGEAIVNDGKSQGMACAGPVCCAAGAGWLMHMSITRGALKPPLTLRQRHERRLQQPAKPPRSGCMQDSPAFRS